MKFLVGIVSLFILCWTAPLCAEPLKIKMAYENTALPPFYLGEGDTIPENPGITVELLQLLDRKLPDIEIVFRRAPWKRCKKELGKGYVDAMFPASFKVSRQEIGIYPSTNNTHDSSRKLSSLSYFFYIVRGTSIDWDGKHAEVNGIAGAPTGYSVVDDLHKMGLEVDDRASTTLQNLLKLQTQRVAVAALQDVTADPLISSNSKFKDIVKLEPPINTKPNYLMFSHQFYKAHPEVAELIWQELPIIRGEHFKQLSHKYLE